MTIQVKHLIPVSSEIHTEPWARAFAPYGVVGEYLLSGMRFKIRYYIGEKNEPLDVVLEGLRKLRKSRDALYSLTHLGVAMIPRPQSKRRRRIPTYKFSIANEHQKNPGLATAEVADCVAEIILPHPEDWKKAGFQWLMNHCRCCRAEQDEYLPWLNPPCKRKNQ